MKKIIRKGMFTDKSGSIKKEQACLPESKNSEINVVMNNLNIIILVKNVEIEDFVRY